MSEIRKLRKTGNSIDLALPPEIREKMGVDVGDYLEIQPVSDDLFIVRKLKEVKDA